VICLDLNYNAMNCQRMQTSSCNLAFLYPKPLSSDEMNIISQAEAAAIKLIP